MNDERAINLLGDTKRKFSIYVIILALTTILLKLILNHGFVFIESLPEIVLLLSLLITNITKPKEEIEDERVVTAINKHFNQAFIIILPLVILTYLLSIFILYKSSASFIILPNLFINIFLLLIFIGLIFLVRKYQIYLNYKFLERKYYFLNVLKVIGIAFIVTAVLVLISFIMNFIISGPNAFIALLLVLVSSFVNLSLQYFLYSIYEYNHFHEMIEINKGRIPIITRNMYLYLGIIVFFGFISLILNIVSRYIMMGNFFNSIAVVLAISAYASKINVIYYLVFLTIITFSLKTTVLRLKEYSQSLINNVVIITIVYVSLSFLHSLVFEIMIRIFYNRVDILNLISNISVWVSFIISLIYLVVLIIRYKYVSKLNFPLAKLLLIPIIFYLLQYLNKLIIIFFQKISFNIRQLVFIEAIINLIIFIILSINYFFIIHKYLQPYEIIKENTIFELD